ncbi:AGAP004152-PA-like protein [Anopheles sinensis]|uniref:AGAP004152-PA-like protein n=1 Tax=Anopheles sinensis TaxID=74873 RepID=A0A084WTM0_ANOSI|nr:AGAP004152-PA-like protein [Anopheles sinensis]
MPSCTVHFLQSVIAMTHDESERVRKICLECRKSVAHFTISIAGNRMDELFFDALNKMPRTIYRGEEREQIASFQLITGYLNFFSEPQLADVLASPNILEQFILTLLAAAELDGVDELIRREYVSYRFEYEEGFRMQKEKKESRWIVLKNVQSPRARRAYLELIHALHQHASALNTVMLYILDDFYTTKMNSNGYLFILCELIPNEVEMDQRMETFKNILSEMLQPHHWFVELDENDNILDQKYNALHVCLVLRIISKFALLMRENFRWYLYDALRAILQCSGSTLNCINESAEMALDTVAIAQGMPNIQALLHDNLDYISQHVTRCLRRSEQLRDGLAILESVLRFVPYESSDVLESTVTPIVMNILDSYSQYGERNAIVCLRVLQIFIHSIRLRYREESAAPREAEADSKEMNNLSEQIKRLESLLTSEVSNEPEVLEEPDPDNAFNEDPDDPDRMEEDPSDAKMEDEIIPPHVKIVLRILSVNYKYLSSSNDAERIISLSTINEGIYILQRYENQLLPLVHNIWYNLTERFTDRNPAVVSNAFDLLVTLARLSHDFIRQRSLA